MTLFSFSSTPRTGAPILSREPIFIAAASFWETPINGSFRDVLFVQVLKRVNGVNPTQDIISLLQGFSTWNRHPSQEYRTLVFGRLAANRNRSKSAIFNSRNGPIIGEMSKPEILMFLWFQFRGMCHVYEVNMRAELEILTLHEKIAEIREMKWGELIYAARAASGC